MSGTRCSRTAASAPENAGRQRLRREMLYALRSTTAQRSGEAAGLPTVWLRFLLPFTNARPGMNTNIVGTTNVDHLEDNIAAASGPLPPDTYAEA